MMWSKRVDRPRFGQGRVGLLEVSDDDFAGYAHQVRTRVHWGSYDSANGETYPGVKK